ncbi:MAG: endonuclease Q family protein [Candidatus Cloacimonetes bacterium]|nr:endonuclease Q family protein [Candidatus Cloacimonadota bacterium]
MKLAVDLHSHSGYAGGVGDIQLTDIATTMKRKGIDVFGTGDCIYPPRAQELEKLLEERESGLFALPGDSSRFVLQTEVIFSTRISGHSNKIIAHHVILFPGFAQITEMQRLMENWSMKNTIGRPFITSESRDELLTQLEAIADINPFIEIIPAHIMTPDGVLGSKNGLSSFGEFYGDFLPNIHAVETGLSADPAMLVQIPQVAQMAMISSSDCHSAALNRVGREFTQLEVGEISYNGIIEAIRQRRVVMTAEFHPSEGRYYLTGHRANRSGHSSAIQFNPPPENGICPVCNKKVLTGVKQRCLDLRDTSLPNTPQKFLHLLPLVEVLAWAEGLKNPASKRVLKRYEEVLGVFPSEISMWLIDDSDIIGALTGKTPEKVIESIVAVKNSNFRFIPPGFDGTYGQLHISLD